MQQVVKPFLNLDRVSANKLGDIPDECSVGVYILDQDELNRCILLNIGILRIWSGKPVVLLNKKELRELNNAGH